MKPSNFRRSRAFACLLLATGIFVAGCGKDITPPANTDIIAGPQFTPVVRASIGRSSIGLTWTVGDSSKASEYRVYRSRQVTGTFAFLASVRVSAYLDPTVIEGTPYFYQVVQILSDGRSSPRSETVAVTPGTFAVLIDQGRERTNNLNLSLQLIAPAGTQLMEVSDNPDFTGAGWESFSTSRSINLAPGDGPRTVYARFKQGGLASETVSDEIILDTQAFIQSVSCAPAGGILSPGTAIHLRLVPRGNETGGLATVDIGQRIKGLQLQDQGTLGDQTANDGVYELDYTLPRNSDVLRVALVGHFTDLAGNKAPDLPADSLFSLHTPVSPVEILSVRPVGDPTSSSLDVSWSPTNAPGFLSYQVMRADAPNGQPASSAFGKLTTISDRNTATFNDNGARDGQPYAYRVDVVDSLGFTAAGSPVLASARSLAGVILSDPQAAIPPDTLNVVLNWTQTTDPSFSSYQVLRAEGADMGNVPADAAFSTIRTETGKTTLSFTDLAPRENSFLWYRVDEISSTGGRHRSNARPYQSPNAPPPAVTMAAPFEGTDLHVSLSWTRSQAKDFLYYRVYRGRGSNVDTSLATLVRRSADINTGSVIDSAGLLDATQYFYKVWVTDRGGLATASGEQNLTTKNQPPPPVNIISSGQAAQGASIVWQPSTAVDFDSYKIYRARDGSVSNGSTLIGTINDKSSASFLDSFGPHGSPDTLRPNTDYYFRVYVYDKGGLSAGGNVQLVHTGPWSQAAILPQAVKPRRIPTRTGR